MSRADNILEMFKKDDRYSSIDPKSFYIVDEDTKSVLFGPYPNQPSAEQDLKKLVKDFEDAVIILGRDVIKFEYELPEG